MATIDMVASALDALASHLETGLDDAVAAVRRGWPEHNEEFGLEGGPVLTVTASQPERSGIHPLSLGTADDEGDLEVTYKVANVFFAVQLDAFAAYRAQLDDLVPLVEALLHNKLPATSDLWLTQGSYHGRPLRFSLEQGPTRRQESADALEGDWRATWTLRCETDEVAVATFPTADRLDTTYDFAERGSTVQETETVVSGT